MLIIGISDRIKSLFDSCSGRVNVILDELSIPEPTFYRSLKTHNWKLEHIAGIAKYFNVSIDYLVFGKEPSVELEELKRKYKTLQEHAEILRKNITVLMEMNKELTNV